MWWGLRGSLRSNIRERHLFHQEIWNDISYSTGDVCGRWFTGIWSSNPSYGQVPFHDIDLNWSWFQCVPHSLSGMAFPHLPKNAIKSAGRKWGKSNQNGKTARRPFKIPSKHRQHLEIKINDKDKKNHFITTLVWCNNQTIVLLVKKQTHIFTPRIKRVIPTSLWSHEFQTGIGSRDAGLFSRRFSIYRPWCMWQIYIPNEFYQDHCHRRVALWVYLEANNCISL